MTPEDRFADLGPDRRSAAERFAELDEREPEEEPRRPREPPRQGRYGWVIAIAFVIVIAVGLINLIPNTGAGYKGIPAGKQLPPFAAPLVGGPDKDANLQQKKSGGVPGACDVHLARVFNVCDAKREHALVLVFVANASRGCEDQLDRVERVRRQVPKVEFVGVISKRSQSDAQDIVRTGGWGFPIVLDRDAQLFNNYGIGDCPTTIFAHRGGLVQKSRRGKLTEEQIRAEAATLRP